MSSFKRRRDRETRPFNRVARTVAKSFDDGFAIELSNRFGDQVFVNSRIVLSSDSVQLSSFDRHAEYEVPIENCSERDLAVGQGLSVDSPESESGFFSASTSTSTSEGFYQPYVETDETASRSHRSTMTGCISATADCIAESGLIASPSENSVRASFPATRIESSDFFEVR